MRTGEFVECPQCDAKPGSPTLCPSCLSNRGTISRLNERIEELEAALAIITKTAGLVSAQRSCARS